MSIITMRSRRFPANSASDCLRFAKFRPLFSESCGTTYTHICEMFIALQSTSSPVTDFGKQRPNRFINDDAIVPQTGTKLTKNAVINLALCCGAIWRHRENRNTGAQLLSILYTSAQKSFWKIYFLYDFWCAQTCTFRAVFGPPMRNLTLAVSAM